MNFHPELWAQTRIYRRNYDPERNNADWNRQEDEDLVRGFLRGDSLRTLADRHKRKINAVETRLNTGRAAVSCESPVKYPREVIKPVHKCEFSLSGFSGIRRRTSSVYECKSCGVTCYLDSHREVSIKEL